MLLWGWETYLLTVYVWHRKEAETGLWHPGDVAPVTLFILK